MTWRPVGGYGTADVTRNRSTASANRREPGLRVKLILLAAMVSLISCDRDASIPVRGADDLAPSTTDSPTRSNYEVAFAVQTKPTPSEEDNREFTGGFAGSGTLRMPTPVYEKSPIQEMLSEPARMISASTLLDDLIPVLTYIEFQVGYAAEDDLNSAIDQWLSKYSNGSLHSISNEWLIGLLFAIESPNGFDKQLAKLRTIGIYRGECMFESGFDPESLSYERQAYLKAASALGYSEQAALQVLRACDSMVNQNRTAIAADYFAVNRHVYIDAIYDYAARSGIPGSFGIVLVE